MFDRQQFIDDLKWLATQDVPFLHQGRGLNGMDCIYVPRWGYERQKPLPTELAKEFDAYHVKPDGVRLLRVLREWFPEISREEARPADMLLFYARRNPQHLATLVGQNDVVEAYSGLNVQRVLHQPLDERRRVVACFRIPDFT